MSNTYDTLHQSNQTYRLKFLLKDSFVYGLAGAVNRVLILITFPIIVRFFPKDEFGEIDAINYIAALALPFVILGLDSAVARYFYDVEDKGERKKIVSEGLLFYTIFSILISVILLLFSEQLLFKYLGNNTYSQLFRLSIISLPLRGILSYNMGLCKWMLKRNAFLILSLDIKQVCVPELYKIYFANF